MARILFAEQVAVLPDSVIERVNFRSNRADISWALVQIDLDGYEEKARTLATLPEIDLTLLGAVRASGPGLEPQAQEIARVTSGTISDVELVAVMKEVAPKPIKFGVAAGMPLMLLAWIVLSAILLWFASLVVGPFSYFSSRVLVFAHLLVCGLFLFTGAAGLRNSLASTLGPTNPFEFTTSRLLSIFINPLRRLFHARFTLGLLSGMLGNAALWHFKPRLFLNAYEVGLEQYLRRLHPYLRRKARRKGGLLTPDPDLLVRSMNRELEASSLLLLPLSAAVFALAQGWLQPPTIFLTYLMHVSIIGAILIYASWLVGAQALFLVQSASDRPVVTFVALAASHMALLLILKLWADHAGGMDLTLVLAWQTATGMFDPRSGLCLATFSCGSKAQWLANLAILLFYSAVLSNLYAALTGRESDAARVNKAGLSVLAGDLVQAEKILSSVKNRSSETVVPALVAVKLRKGEIAEAWEMHDALLQINGSKLSRDSRLFAFSLDAAHISDVGIRISLYKFCVGQGISDWSLINTIETVEIMNGAPTPELIKIYLSLAEHFAHRQPTYAFTLRSGGLSLNALTATQLFYDPSIRASAAPFQEQAFRARAHLYGSGEAGSSAGSFDAAPLLDAFAAAPRPEKVYCLAYLLNTLQTCQVAKISWDRDYVGKLLPLFETFDREPAAETGEDMMVLTREQLSEAISDSVAKRMLGA